MAGVSPGELADAFETVGTWGLRLEEGRALGSGQFTELPTANEDFRALVVNTDHKFVEGYLPLHWRLAVTTGGTTVTNTFSIAAVLLP